jgi:hypothetical protein
MRDATRVAVALAMGLATLTSVLLISMAGPLLRATAAGMWHVARIPTLNHETVARGFLIGCYVAILAIGMMHAKRTEAARAQRRPKARGKPEVGAGPGWVLFAALLGYSVVGVLLALFQVDPAQAGTLAIFGATGAGLVVPWIVLGMTLGLACEGANEGPTCEKTMRAMVLVPAGVITAMGYNITNLGLLLGLWVMMAMLSGLEDKQLPADYPETFDDQPSAASPA